LLKADHEVPGIDCFIGCYDQRFKEPNVVTLFDYWQFALNRAVLLGVSLAPSLDGGGASRMTADWGRFVGRSVPPRSTSCRSASTSCAGT
jgi:hypothetical protein